MRIILGVIFCGLVSSCTKPAMYLVSNQTDSVKPVAFTYALAENEIADPTSSDITIQNELDRQVQKKGFWRSPKDPDILVFFKYYPEKLSLPQVVQATNNQKLLVQQKMPKGTFMVQWVHRDTQETWWQGYVVGVPSGLESRQWRHLIQQLGQRFPGQPMISIEGRNRQSLKSGNREPKHVDKPIANYPPEVQQSGE